MSQFLKSKPFEEAMTAAERIERFAEPGTSCADISSMVSLRRIADSTAIIRSWLPMFFLVGGAQLVLSIVFAATFWLTR